MNLEKRLNQLEEYVKMLSKSVEDLTSRVEILEKKSKQDQH